MVITWSSSLAFVPDTRPDGLPSVRRDDMGKHCRRPSGPGFGRRHGRSEERFSDRLFPGMTVWEIGNVPNSYVAAASFGFDDALAWIWANPLNNSSKFAKAALRLGDEVIPATLQVLAKGPISCVTAAVIVLGCHRGRIGEFCIGIPISDHHARWIRSFLGTNQSDRRRYC
jgi:hypothetical protein